MKDYVLNIRNKKDINIFIKCKDMKDVENRLFEYSGKITDFEIYKSINNDEVIELTKLCLDRFINNLNNSK